MKLFWMFFIGIFTACSTQCMEKVKTYTMSYHNHKTENHQISDLTKEEYLKQIKNFNFDIYCLQEEKNYELDFIKAWMERFKQVNDESLLLVDVIQPKSALPYNIPWFSIRNKPEYERAFKLHQKRNDYYFSTVKKSIEVIRDAVNKHSVQNTKDIPGQLELYVKNIDNALDNKDKTLKEIKRIYAHKKNIYANLNLLNQFWKALLGVGTNKQIAYTLSLTGFWVGLVKAGLHLDRKGFLNTPNAALGSLGLYGYTGLFVLVAWVKLLNAEYYIPQE